MSKCKGFTLIELIITMAILSVICAIAFSAILGLINSYNYNKKVLEAEKNVRLAAMLITKEVRKADPETVTVENDVLHFTTHEPSEKSHVYQKIDASVGDGEAIPWQEICEKVEDFSVTQVNGGGDADDDGDYLEFKIKVEFANEFTFKVKFVRGG